MVWIYNFTASADNCIVPFLHCFGLKLAFKCDAFVSVLWCVNIFAIVSYGTAWHLTGSERQVRQFQALHAVTQIWQKAITASIGFEQNVMRRLFGRIKLPGKKASVLQTVLFKNVKLYRSCETIMRYVIGPNFAQTTITELLCLLFQKDDRRRLP